MSRLHRATRETDVVVRCSVGTGSTAGAGSTDVTTTDAFLDHMLLTLARFAGMALEVKAAGDLQHHLLEDVAITLGLCLREEVPEQCARYGHAVVPMDEALVEVVVDVGGRAHYTGPLPSSLYDHIMRSLAHNAGFTLHIRVLRGEDRHHVVEAAFKALGLALRQALAPGQAVFSTKGSVTMSWEEDA